MSVLLTFVRVANTSVVYILAGSTYALEKGLRLDGRMDVILPVIRTKDKCSWP